MLYPTATESRMVFDLDGIWKFQTIQEKAPSPDCCAGPLSNPRPIAVPSSYNDLYADDSVRDHIGWVIYEREFVVQPSLLSQRVVLHFGSVTHRARVFLNGVFMSEHVGGFTPFEVETGKVLRLGRNRLSVLVSNVIDRSTLPVGFYEEREVPGLGQCKSDRPNFDFFNYSGIHRPVRLCTTPASHIRDITVCPKIIGDGAEITYSVDCVGSGDIAVRILNEENAVTAYGTGANGTLSIQQVKLWQPLHAYLYRLEARLMQNGKTVDIYEEPFGVREVRVENGRVLINGRPFYFKGFGKHEDFDIIGKGLCEPLNVKDLELFKWIGANSFRTSHYPYSEEMMRLADREGIVVIDKTPAVGLNMNFDTLMLGGTPAHSTWKELHTAENHRRVLTELIERDKNHPCVVMWSIANEAATEEEGAYEYFKPLVELAKRLDRQQRPVTLILHLNSLPQTCKVAGLCDVLALNRYYGWYSQCGDLAQAKVALHAELEAWQTLCPEKPIMLTEYGADTVAGMHEVTPSMFSEEYQVEMLRANNETADMFPHFVGEHVWCFADFATGQGLLRVGGNKKGVFTRDRRPKLAAHYLRRRWKQIPDFDYKP